MQENPVLVLDAGNFIGRRNPSYGYDTEITLDCLQKMGYDAVAIGEKEISWGLDELEEELAAHDLVPVSNNIFDSETDEYRFPPYRVVQVGDLKVGVTSTIGGGSVVPRTLKEREGITVEDPIESSNTTLKELRKEKVDVALLIAHVGLQKAEEWAADFSGYDVVIVGHGGQKLLEPKKEAGVILAATGARSDWFGQLTLTVEDRQILSFSGKSYQMKQSEGPFDEEMRVITWTKLELDENGNRIRKSSTKKGEAKSTDTSQSSAVKEKQFGAGYLGGSQCALCHADIQEHWLKTAHADAFRSVAESEEWEKSECWNCHVVGFGEKTGHPKTGLEPALWNVQCEACHGQGSEHDRTGEWAKVTEETCRGCHTEKWSPDFDYKKAVRKVACTGA